VPQEREVADAELAKPPKSSPAVGQMADAEAHRKRVGVDGHGPP